MTFFFISLTSFLITALTIPVTIFLAKKYGLVDDPRKRPHPAHVHKVVLPRAGGLPIYLGILLTSLFFLPLEKNLLGILVAITLLLLIGLVDDKRREFNPYIRLIFLFLAAGIAVSSGIGISFITNPFAQLLGGAKYLHLDTIVIPFTFIGPHRLIILADIFAFLWIVSLTQVINWAKGVDGQMPGITLVTSLVLAALSLRIGFQGDVNQFQVAKLSFIVAGTSLGFLIFNWPPAKILPGFSASTILAFMLASLAILSGAKVATAILALAVPVIDFVYTILRRVLSGRSPVWGDRGHLHHRLLDLGWNSWQISLFYIFGSAILGLVALLVETTSKLFVILGVGAVFTVAILWLNSFGGLSGRPDPDNGSKT